MNMQINGILIISFLLVNTLVARTSVVISSFEECFEAAEVALVVSKATPLPSKNIRKGANHDFSWERLIKNTKFKVDAVLKGKYRNKHYTLSYETVDLTRDKYGFYRALYIEKRLLEFRIDTNLDYSKQEDIPGDFDPRQPSFESDKTYLLLLKKVNGRLVLLDERYLSKFELNSNINVLQPAVIEGAGE
ncbi:hypothetical protein [Pelagicoccus mobilis]|uniref:Uncharacterized protein n=1 Tax=Pelagicoccus mobilis TaxID=415221 RepID=A0A934RU81_9BACT|nr:hypothetical protein [Pelagicoccus mobilis]MBK1875505.1 hypothetical protein [Pelagicoccus mobilis]